MIKWLANLIILWAIKMDHHPIKVVSHRSKGRLFMRYCPLWPDEWRGYNRPPWYRPFNILFHHWFSDDEGSFHDHPRWSVTICLRGKLIEHTPWGSRELTAGSVVVRSRKFIHSFELPADQIGRTWTMFIVGRRNWQQNGYLIKPFDSGLPTQKKGAK